MTEVATDAEKYRADVDGLRAVAVLAVVGYHAFPEAVPNGFIGVDIFFVISGFLISRNIGTALAAGRFSFADFYGRRIRRIFPAMLIVLAAVYAAGWVSFYPNEFAQLAKHTAAGAGFIANFVFNAESGYFDNSPFRKPLLHLWSLGVEEQFYIVWPALLWLAWRTTNRWTSVLIATGAASFVLCIVMTGRDESAAFYLPLTRVWQFAAGAWLGLPGTPRWRGVQWQREIAVAAGVLAIVATVLLAIDLRPLPGWWAVVPVAAATLIIAGGPDTTVSRLLLANPIAIWIGLISYPLYLWHWPLLSFGRILDTVRLSPTERVTLVIVSVVLAWLTFSLIERPIRQRHATGLAAGLLLIGLIVTAVTGYATYAADGIQSRAVVRAAQPYLTSMKSTFKDECAGRGATSGAGNWPCHLNPSGRSARAMIVGDSHAMSLVPAFEQVAVSRGEDVLWAGMASCPPLLDVQVRARDTDGTCRQLNEQVLRYVTTHGITDVFLVASWSYYTVGSDYEGQFLALLTTGTSPATPAGSRAAFEQGLDATLARYRAAGVRLHVVQQVPTQLRYATELIRAAITRRGDPAAAIRSVSVPLADHRRMASYAATEFARRDIRDDLRLPAILLDLDAAYCDADVCAFARPDVSYYTDNNHLSVSGARLAVPLIAARFAAIDALAR